MAAAEPDIFFKQKRTTSEIKDKILPAYFNSWYNCHLKSAGTQLKDTLLFVDVNAGDGYAPQGRPAPVAILENCYQSASANPNEKQPIKLFFVNPTEALTEKLKDNLAQLPFYPELLDKLEVLRESAFLEQVADSLPDNKAALLYLDPARPGLSRQLLTKGQQSPATDVLLIFNFNKLQQLLTLDETEEWAQAFWGSRLTEVKNIFLTEVSVKKRESLFISAFEAVLKEAGFYTFKFEIAPPVKNAATQYLMLLTKSLGGYLGMKELMQFYSEYQEDGVPLFQVTNKPPTPLLPGFFQYLSNYTMDNLVAELSKSRSQFHYKTLQAIYEEHSVGTNYVKMNYRKALEKLQAQGVLYPVDAQNKKAKAITDTSVIFYNLHRSKK